MRNSATCATREKIIIKDSEFLTSSSGIYNAPAPIFSEIAILGRSNVGKSSLINAMLNNKNLAKSSQTPGKTRLINFFKSTWIDSNSSANLNADSNSSAKYDLIFIDFPGFGYAKVSKSQKSAWDKNLSAFLKKRNSIKLFLHLIDSRHLNLAIDKEINDFLTSIARKNIVLKIFTKKDKLNSRERAFLKNEILVSINDKNSIESLRGEVLRALYGEN